VWFFSINILRCAHPNSAIFASNTKADAIRHSVGGTPTPPLNAKVRECSPLFRWVSDELEVVEHLRGNAKLLVEALIRNPFE